MWSVIDWTLFRYNFQSPLRTCEEDLRSAASLRQEFRKTFATHDDTTGTSCRIMHFRSNSSYYQIFLGKPTRHYPEVEKNKARLFKGGVAFLNFLQTRSRQDLRCTPESASFASAPLSRWARVLHKLRPTLLPPQSMSHQ